MLLTAGVLRACWPVGLAFVRPGVPGLVLIIVIQFGLVTCCALFNPVLATYRLDQTPADRVARTLSAWSVGTSAAIAAAGVLLLATPLLLPRRANAAQNTAEPAASLP